MTIGLSYDGSACKKAVLTDPQFQYTQGAGLEGVSWNADAAAACIALVRQSVSMCVGPDDVQIQIRTACSGVLVGSKPPGAACTSPVQCAVPKGSVASCLPSSPGGDPSQSVCQPQPQAAHGKAGDACNATCETAPTLNGSGICEPFPGAPSMGPANGATCYWPDGLACDFGSFTCKPLLGIGDACKGTLTCGNDKTCATVCVAKPQVGDPCDAMSLTSCATGGYCDSGTCVAQRAFGEPCDAGINRECLDGYCRGGKCSPIGQMANNELCTGQSASSPTGG